MRWKHAHSIVCRCDVVSHDAGIQGVQQGQDVDIMTTEDTHIHSSLETFRGQLLSLNYLYHYIIAHTGICSIT
jgi:hypothetical protein